MRYGLFMAVAAWALGAQALRANDKVPIVVLDTSAGKIKIELYADKAPITVKNFLGYVAEKHYDNTIFHRVVPNILIQAGGMERDLTPRRTREAIENESANGLENKRGAIAMQRTRAPNSATAQFFINLKDNSFFDKAHARDGVGYCVFGKVIEGMDVVDKIGAAKTGVRAGTGDVPQKDIVIKSVEVLK
jgi:cyclophilin family peptidyl-prolyl cis-trans isomerase